MNHVTTAEREALLEAAMYFTLLAEDGSVVDFQQTADEFAKAYGVSIARARGAVSKAARLKRGEIVRSRPGPEPMGDGMQPVTVYLSASQIERARSLGAGNVSAGARMALEQEDKMKQVLLVGRHAPDGMEEVEVVEQRSITFPVDGDKAVAALVELENEQSRLGRWVLLQNCPASLAAGLARHQYLAGQDASGPGTSVGFIVSEPGPRPGKVERDFFVCDDTAASLMAAVQFANPRAEARILAYDEPDSNGNVGYEPGRVVVRVTVDGPPAPFVFSHIEWV